MMFSLKSVRLEHLVFPIEKCLYLCRKNCKKIPPSFFYETLLGTNTFKVFSVLTWIWKHFHSFFCSYLNMTDNIWCISEFVLEKTIYPHIYCHLGFHMKIEMPALDLAQNFVCSARINLGNFCLNLSLQNSKQGACCLG